MDKCIYKFAGILPGVALLWACSSDPEEVDCNNSDLMVSIVNTTNPGCNQSNGMISVTGSGGAGSYTYSIDGVNFSNTANFDNLAAGAYTISVRDNNQCTATVPTTLTTQSNLVFTSAVVNAGCNVSNGSITVTATGGVAPYTYRLNQGNFQSANAFANLSSGSFAVTVKDNVGCETTQNVNVVSGGSMSLTATVVNAGCNTSNGSITVSTTGGAAPYMYRLNQGDFQSGNAFTNLSSGTFAVTVKDNGGCESIENVTVRSGLTLSMDIKPIIDANCAISGCHVGGDLPDWRNSANIIANAANIRTKTTDKSMPPAGSPALSNEQIQRIACWVNDGAPNN